MICSKEGCENEASFEITHTSNNGRTTVKEYRCSSHMNIKKRDLRENKMMLIGGRSKSQVRSKSRAGN